MNSFIIEHINKIEKKFSMSGQALLESLQNKLTREQYRKCCFIMTTYCAVSEDVLNQQRTLHKYYIDASNIYKILKTQGLDNGDIYSLWIIIRLNHFNRNLNLKAMKRPPKQDNKDVLVGSGHGNMNKIRYPKKCRKTAWKRFYKLFPNLKPDSITNLK